MNITVIAVTVSIDLGIRGLLGYRIKDYTDLDRMLMAKHKIPESYIQKCYFDYRNIVFTGWIRIAI